MWLSQGCEDKIWLVFYQSGSPHAKLDCPSENTLSIACCLLALVEAAQSAFSVLTIPKSEKKT